MKTLHLSIIVICISVEIFSSGIVNAVIAPSIMILQTDRESYQKGDTVMVSGLVADDLAQENPTVFIQIFNPDGLLYYKKNVPLEKVDNPTWNKYTYGFKYSYKFQLNSTNSGDYEITVSNHSEKYLTKWMVKIVTQIGRNPNPDEYKIFQMPTLGSNDTNSIKYNVSKDTSLLDMSYERGGGSNIITILVHTVDGGQFSIQIPRKLADSKYDNGTDRSFGVSMGSLGGSGSATNNFKEIENNSNYRTLQIALPQSNSTVDIMISGWQTSESSSIVTSQSTQNLGSLQQQLDRLRSHTEIQQREKQQAEDENTAIILAEVGIPIAAGISVGMFLFTRKRK